MTDSQATVARATAAVFLADRRLGSAVLIDDRHLITAEHVTLLLGSDHVKRPSDQVEVEFPASAGSQSHRLLARRVGLGPKGAATDVAVLDLGENLPAWMPAPVAIWPAARLPASVHVFGYPLSEGPLNGVWRTFTVVGPTSGETMQLDWAGDAGTFPGHSGGPVIDSSTHTLVGILVAGSIEGHFDRFVPITLIAKAWPYLPRRWLMVGTGLADARTHFTRRAQGQRSAARGGDLFRGRQSALADIHRWLTADSGLGRPLVVTGQPGAGKSAVLARVVLALEAENNGPGSAFHARSATIGDFMTAVGGLVGLEPPTSTDQLVEALAELLETTGQKPRYVAVDALDEAASDTDRRQIAETLTELPRYLGSGSLSPPEHSPRGSGMGQLHCFRRLAFRILTARTWWI